MMAPMAQYQGRPAKKMKSKPAKAMRPVKKAKAPAKKPAMPMPKRGGGMFDDII